MSAQEKSLAPLHVFNFQVDFYEDSLGTATNSTSDLHLCGGAFSECTGLEATMEPKVIKEGGRNYGAAQRAGSVTFATVILKRGMTKDRGLWRLFKDFSDGMYAPRVAVYITLNDGQQRIVMIWKLINAMPVKIKIPDLNAKGSEVGIEELHLVHEGIELVKS